MKLTLLGLVTAMLIFSGCVSESQIGEMLKKNPKLITDAIKENPSEFIDALNEAVKKAQADQRAKQEEDEKKKLEASFENPLKPEIRSDELIRGTKGAPIVVVEYSDFECPFCRRGYTTVMDLLDKYKGKVQFVYKHLPLSFHQNAMPASKYYEAIRLQSEDKAIKFHDELYENQGKLKNGEKFLQEAAKKVGANMSKLKKDLDSDEVQQRIDEDMAEAAKYGFQGTPGFLLNGIPIKGAYPMSHFEDIIKKLEEKGKLSL